MEKRISLCPMCDHCPEVVLVGNEVQIGEAGNLVVLKKDEWNVLVDAIKSRRLRRSETGGRASRSDGWPRLVTLIVRSPPRRPLHRTPRRRLPHRAADDGVRRPGDVENVARQFPSPYCVS
jgi:hypothetical protein